MRPLSALLVGDLRQSLSSHDDGRRPAAPDAGRAWYAIPALTEAQRRIDERREVAQRTERWVVGEDGLVTGSPNGVSVRGLRVLYSTEYRRTSIWKTVLSFVFHDPVAWDDYWGVLTVRNGPRNVVARRRFSREKDAKEARERFVEVIADMSQDAYEGADWQAVLDAT
jgi:hypothetical protein